MTDKDFKFCEKRKWKWKELESRSFRAIQSRGILGLYYLGTRSTKLLKSTMNHRHCQWWWWYVEEEEWSFRDGNKSLPFNFEICLSQQFITFTSQFEKFNLSSSIIISADETRRRQSWRFLFILLLLSLSFKMEEEQSELLLNQSLKTFSIYIFPHAQNPHHH